MQKVAEGVLVGRFEVGVFSLCAGAKKIRYALPSGLKINCSCQLFLRNRESQVSGWFRSLKEPKSCFKHRRLPGSSCPWPAKLQ